MRRILLTLILFAASGMAVGQNTSLPYWVNRTPKAENETYYFRVTHATERTYEQAYAKAFSMAILESSWKMGLPVDTKDDMAAIEKGVEGNLSIHSRQSNIAINKVCECQIKSAISDKVTLYILWQVQAAGNIEPDFGYFEKCN